MQDPRIGVDGLNLRVDLAGTQATISRLEGQVNGGTLSGERSLSRTARERCAMRT